MFPVTELELKAALAKLPEPASVSGPCITVPIPNSQDDSWPKLYFRGARSLTFHKCVRGNGLNDPWHNEWMLEHTPRPFAVEGHVTATFDEEDSARIIEAMEAQWQKTLLEIATTLVDQMEFNTADMVLRRLNRRLADLDRMCLEVAGDGTGEALPDFDLAEARAGRPGGRTYDGCIADDPPGDDTPKPVRDWASGGMRSQEPEADLDYFKIANDIRKGATAYNHIVRKAYNDASIVLKTTINKDGTIHLDSIQLELSL